MRVLKDGPQFCGLEISPYWRPVSLVFAQTGERKQHFDVRRSNNMFGLTTVQIIQILCGVLAVVGILILVLRRRGKKK
jgi:hypothetical protein